MRLILVALVSFAAGVAMDRALFNDPVVKQPASSLVTLPTQAGAAAAAPEKAAPVAGTRSPVPLSAALATHLQPARIAVPEARITALPASSEARLRKLIAAALPELRDPMEHKNDDGSLDVTGTGEDGRNVFRHFNPRGDLTREGWTTTGGEALYRNFYDSGGIRQFSFYRPGESRTTVMFTESGSYEARAEQLPDGTQISVTFDDLGQPKQVWKTDKSGKSVELR